MVLQQKIEMLDSLLEIEIAYTMLKAKSDGDSAVHPLDAHYAKLNTQIEVIDKDTDEFELLKQYVRNTHAVTHTQYDLEILEVCLVTIHIVVWCVGTIISEEHVTSIFKLEVSQFGKVPGCVGVGRRNRQIGVACKSHSLYSSLSTSILLPYLGCLIS
jgi:hypothetical protein